MKVSCVISEFNPFHNGHKYLIEKHIENGASHIIAVMSGSFVQRGECSSFNKFDRAECAVKNGADLVVELPTVWACAAAPVFAKGGISLINSFGVADCVFFGSESGNIAEIQNCAKVLLSDEFKSAFQSASQNGESYATAVQSAVQQIAGENCAGLLSSPNNILAVEYVKEILIRNTGLSVETVARTGIDHDSQTPSGDYASASMIRSNLDDICVISSYVPENTVEILKSAHQKGDVADMTNIENVILYKLRTASATELLNLPDVSEGLENRLKQASLKAKSLDELLSLVVCKRYSLARVRRIIACALLGIDKSMQAENPPYIRVLAFNEKGSELLKRMKKSSSVPVITKASHFRKLLDDRAAEIFEKDVLATDIRALAGNNIQLFGKDFHTSPRRL